MLLRLCCIAPVLLSCGLAADQTPAAPAKGDQPQASRATSGEKKSHWPIHLGGVMVGAGYSHFSGGYPYYGGYPGGWGGYYFDPFLWTPFYHSGFYSGFAYGPHMGDVKLQNIEKTATVYLDGALAGPVEKLKDMWLDPGTYQLEIRDGKRRLTQKIYVLSGKTLKVTAGMMNQEALP